MKKLAVLILMIMSLVVTPVMAGSCEHVFNGMKQDSTVAGNHQAAKTESGHSDTSGSGQTQDTAHVHCCGAHMAAIQPAGDGNVNPFAAMKDRAIGTWTEARYSSLNVGPLLEPPSHA